MLVYLRMKTSEAVLATAHQPTQQRNTIEHQEKDGNDLVDDLIGHIYVKEYKRRGTVNE